MKKDLFDIRREFSLKTLDETKINPDPYIQFETWLDEALQSEAIEPNAMVLSTATPEGKPSSRIVLLKQIQQNGFIFFTNYDSHKGVELRANPYCALNFAWHELERQVRIEGIAEQISPEESDSYFEIRPPKSKLGAWASPQSKVIENRDVLEQLNSDFENKFKDKKITRPLNWGGYIVKPRLFEFWQGRENRLHDRILYQKDNAAWIISRLAP